MFKPVVQYTIPKKQIQSQGNVLRMRNYRYYYKFPSETIPFQALNKLRHTTKQIKTHYALKTLSSKELEVFPIIRGIKKSMRNISILGHMYFLKKSLRFWLSGCKELTGLSLTLSLEDLTTGRLWSDYKALQKLENLELHLKRNDSEYLPLVLENKRLKTIKLHLDNKDFTYPQAFANLENCAERFGLEININDPLILQFMKNNQFCRKVEALSMCSAEDSFESAFGFSAQNLPPQHQNTPEDIQKFLKALINVKSLSVVMETAHCSLDLTLDSLTRLEELAYCGGLHTTKFYTTIIADQITILDLNLNNQDLCSKSLREFTLHLKNFVKLREFFFGCGSIQYANEFICDLPHNMQALKTVELRFYPAINRLVEELKLHMNSFLDWIISLPSLENISLVHPGINYCYCNYLEDCIVLPKLRNVIIIESYPTYDLTMVEVEYTESDLAAVLKILMAETVEQLTLPVRLELFKQRMLDVLEQNLLKCRKLTKLWLTTWFNIMSENLLFKLEKIFKTLYFIRFKRLDIRFYETANKLTDTIVSRKHELEGLQYTYVKFMCPPDDNHW